MSADQTVLGPKNERVRALRRLATQRRVRRAEGLALVEGPRLVAEALAGRRTAHRVREVFHEIDLAPDSLDRAIELGVVLTRVAPGALAKVLDTVTPQPVVATVTFSGEEVAIEDLPPERPVLVLVDLRDPGNLGTLLRTAEAAGCGAVVLAGSCCDPSSPKVVRAAAGSWLRSTIIELDDPIGVVERFRSTGRPVFAAALDGDAESFWTSDLARAAIVIGNEAHGLDDVVVAACGASVIIPFDGPTESLNAAMAGAVLAFEAFRQRSTATIGPAAETRSTNPNPSDRLM